MTVIHTLAPRTSSLRRPVNGPVQGVRYGRDGLARSRRPVPSRPAGAPTRYYGTGVAISVAPHRRRAVTWATTVGLALAAGAITLWLGLVANVGQALNGDSTNSAAPSRTGSPSCGSTRGVAAGCRSPRGPRRAGRRGGRSHP